MFRKLIAFLAAACLTVAFCAASAAGWGQNETGNVFYSLSDEERAVGFTRIEEHFYFFDQEGCMVTGWFEITWEHISSDADAGLIGWHFGGPDGVLLTGFARINGQVYYFDEITTTLVTGYADINGKGYLFGEDGILIVGDTEDLEIPEITVPENSSIPSALQAPVTSPRP